MITEFMSRHDDPTLLSLCSTPSPSPSEDDYCTYSDPSLTPSLTPSSTPPSSPSMDHRPKALFRLLPTCSPPSSIQFDQWIRITVEALGEFGTYQRETDPTRTFRLRDGQTIMPLECALLIESHGHISRISTSNQDLRLDKRALQFSNWDGLDNLAGPGIGPSGRGGLEVRVVRKKLGAPATFWISISSGSNQGIVPLVLGPVRLSRKAFDLSTTMEVLRPFDIIVSHGRVPRIMLLKEVWNNVPQGRVWDSAFILKDMFLSKVMDGIHKSAPAVFAGKRILDLSAGTGLLGLFIAGLAQVELDTTPRRASSAIPITTTVVLTDLEHALDLINHNIHFNKSRIAPSIRLMAKELAWGTSHLARLRGVTFDIVVASDVVYEASNFDHLLETLHGLCTPKHTVVYLGYKRRALTKDSEDDFFNKILNKFKTQQTLHGLDVHVWRLWRE